MNREETKIIEDLLDINYVIMNIYYQLMDQEIENNQEKYQENIEYLNLALEVEDKIYHNFTFPIEEKDRIINKIEYLLRRRNYEGFEKEVIAERIYNYIFPRLYRNPFLSMKQAKEDQEFENSSAILNQYYRDYYYLINYLITKKLKELPYEPVKIWLIQEKYEKIRSYKLEERVLLKEDASKFPNLDGKERCLLFNQNKDLVTEFYIMETVEGMKDALDNLEASSNSSLSERVYATIIFEIMVESMMTLLEKEEQQRVINTLQNQRILDKNSIITSQILKIIKRINQQSKAKKKTKKL